jgi:membrane-associated phospholipid phosphatase
MWEFLAQVNIFFQSLGDWLFYPMRLFSFLGDEEFYLFIMPAIYWSVDSSIGLRMSMLLMLSNGLNGFFKFVFHAPRPSWMTDRVTALVHENSFGVPSGHSQHAVVMWGFLSTQLRKTWLRVLLICIIVFIGLSRLYLGAHFIVDVLVGWLIGFLFLLGFLWIEKKYQPTILAWTPRKKLIVAFIISILLIVVPGIAKTLNSGYILPVEWQTRFEVATEGEQLSPFSIKGAITASGAWMGIIAASVIFQKKIQLGKINLHLGKKTMRFMIGVIGVAGLYLGLKLIFPDNEDLISGVFRYIRYFMIGFWIPLVDPLIFQRFGLHKD